MSSDNETIIKAPKKANVQVRASNRPYKLINSEDNTIKEQGASK